MKSRIDNLSMLSPFLALKKREPTGEDLAGFREGLLEHIRFAQDLFYKLRVRNVQSGPRTEPQERILA